MKLFLTAIHASDHSQGLLLPEDWLGFKVRICKSNVVSQIASVQMRLMMHLNTVIGPKQSSTFMQSDRFQSSLAGTPHPRSNFSFLHSQINDSFFFFFSFPLESERTCSLCGIKKPKKTTAIFFLFFSFPIRGIKVELIQLQLTKIRKTHSLSVRIWISDFVCRWFLLHAFKAGTQSRSTISVLPWLSYVWVDVYVCSMLSILQANTTNAKKKYLFYPFFSVRESH